MLFCWEKKTEQNIKKYTKNEKKCMKIDKMHLKYKNKNKWITIFFKVCLSVCLPANHKLNMLLLIPSLIRYLQLFSTFILSPWIKIILMHSDKCRHTKMAIFHADILNKIIYGPVYGTFRICSFWSISWTNPFKIIKNCWLFLEKESKVSRFHWRNPLLKFSF